MYVAVKGGEKAIDNAHRLLGAERRGDAGIAELTTEQISGQLKLAVARVMAEGSLYDPAVASLAIKQARGDLIEAIFLTRAYRTTLPRFGYSLPVETGHRAAHLRHLQGPAGRADPRGHLRLYPPPHRFRAGLAQRAGNTCHDGRLHGAGAARHRAARRPRPDRA
jgi:Bacterial phosphonate metabolism protein (PhnI)